MNYPPESRNIPEETIRDAEEHAQGYTAPEQSPISNFSKPVNLRFVMKPKSPGLACSPLYKDEKLGLLTLRLDSRCSPQRGSHRVTVLKYEMLLSPWSTGGFVSQQRYQRRRTLSYCACSSGVKSCRSPVPLSVFVLAEPQ